LARSCPSTMLTACTRGSCCLCVLFIATCLSCVCFFFFNITSTTEISTLSLHDALPISWRRAEWSEVLDRIVEGMRADTVQDLRRSEEHTSELQSRVDLVCRLLLEKKKKTDTKRFK